MSKFGATETTCASNIALVDHIYVMELEVILKAKLIMKCLKERKGCFRPLREPSQVPYPLHTL